jgi:hypothetical protein
MNDKEEKRGGWGRRKERVCGKKSRNRRETNLSRVVSGTLASPSLPIASLLTLSES